MAQDLRFCSCQGYITVEKVVQASKLSGLGVFQGLIYYQQIDNEAGKLENCHGLFLTLPPGPALGAGSWST